MGNPQTKKPKKYGVNYMGSKNKIAERLISFLPSADTFVDLFAGGMAMSHCALLSGKYKRVVSNDISDIPEMFVRAVNGYYKDEKRWISREDFFRLKDSDPYVRTCWSFGGNQKNYLYSCKIEDYKRALHCAVVLLDTAPLRTYGINLPEDFSRVTDRSERMRYVRAAIKGRVDLQRLQRLQSLESLERLQRLQSLQSLETSRLDYKSVEIPDNACVYADPPYAGVSSYPGEEFDSEAFWRWARTRDYPLFVSEYNAPEDFAALLELRIKSTLSATNNAKECVEKLFVHERWAKNFGEEYIKTALPTLSKFVNFAAPSALHRAGRLRYKP